MRLYSFYNERTGQYRDIKAAAYHETWNRVPSEKGWKLLGWKNL